MTSNQYGSMDAQQGVAGLSDAGPLPLACFVCKQKERMQGDDARHGDFGSFVDQHQSWTGEDSAHVHAEIHIAVNYMLTLKDNNRSYYF